MKAAIKPRASLEELKFRRIKFSDSSDVVNNKKLLCTSCNVCLRAAVLQGKVNVHPFLSTLLCKKCYLSYNNASFSVDEEDGCDNNCRWCGERGLLYSCSTCTSCFCKKCIQRNLPRSVLRSIVRSDDKWSCFCCDVKPLYELRALCWAALNFVNGNASGASSKEDSNQQISASSLKRKSSTKESSEDGSSEPLEKRKMQSLLTRMDSVSLDKFTSYNGDASVIMLTSDDEGTESTSQSTSIEQVTVIEKRKASTKESSKDGPGEPLEKRKIQPFLTKMDSVSLNKATSLNGDASVIIIASDDEETETPSQSPPIEQQKARGSIDDSGDSDSSSNNASLRGKKRNISRDAHSDLEETPVKKVCRWSKKVLATSTPFPSSLEHYRSHESHHNHTHQQVVQSHETQRVSSTTVEPSEIVALSTFYGCGDNGFPSPPHSDHQDDGDDVLSLPPHSGHQGDGADGPPSPPNSDHQDDGGDDLSLPHQSHHQGDGADGLPSPPDSDHRCSDEQLPPQSGEVLMLERAERGNDREMPRHSGKSAVSFLQEILCRIIPQYELVRVEGAAHEPTFHYRVNVGQLSAMGTGRSKKAAKHAAAEAVLEKIQEHPAF